MPEKPSFRFTTVVWGQEFTDGFLRVALPSLLTPGNLPAFAASTDSRYRIYTTPDNISALAGSPACRHLASVMPLEFATVHGISRVGKYRSMTQCHADFVRSHRNESCAFFFIFPDVVWADGAYRRLLEIHRAGKRMVAVTTPRLAKETFVPEYLSRFGRNGGVAPMTPRELVGLGMKHLHPITRSQFWQPAPGRRTHTGDLFWAVTDDSFLARAFHLQPLMVRPNDPGVVPVVAIDADYTLKACPDAADIHVVEDSDELCCLDFTSSRDRAEYIIEPQTVEALAAAASELTNRLHREFFRHRIRFHAGEPSGPWAELERQSDAVVDALLASIREAPPPPSPFRYFSPAFWRRKVSEVGGASLVRQARDRAKGAILRRILGPTVRIEVLPASTAT